MTFDDLGIISRHVFPKNTMGSDRGYVQYKRIPNIYADYGNDVHIFMKVMDKNRPEIERGLETSLCASITFLTESQEVQSQKQGISDCSYASLRK
jgi:hypothetical protein